MNLIDLIVRKSPNLAIGQNLPVLKPKWKGETWRAVQITSTGATQIRIENIDSVYALRSRPKSVGWYARTSGENVEVEVDIVDESGQTSKSQTAVGQIPVPISIEWPADPKSKSRSFRLKALGPDDAKVDIFVQRALDRSFLYKHAKGEGVEIGPGPSPQIFRSDEVSVRYVEEMSAEEWRKLYDQQGKRGAATADWSSYIIGTADNIPAEPESLDFIFSSHVFEHLANPLGHLRRWRDLLRPDGVVLAVVPEMTATKDMIGTPSTLADIDFEDAINLWQPMLSHYQRFGATRGWNSKQAADMFAARSSIHIHFYDLPLISALLQSCINTLGFSRFEINYAPNHKDFHFALWR